MKKYSFKKLLGLTLIILMIFSMTINSITFAKNDSGKIDFFKAFSKSAENIDMIGNKIYNWSIYLPSDAVIDKNPKATSFNMNTNSFKANVSVNIYKNIHNLTIEQIYAASLLKNSSDPYYDYYSYDYKCSAKIQSDKQNNRYISITSIIPEYSAYGSVNSDEEKGTYTEERTYIGKSNDINYIYKVNISMDLSFYKQHQNLFYKLADSFKTSFDSKNLNIKDLSDLATSYRTFDSKIYGWKIELAPYWKLQNQETATTVKFKPLYSLEEIGSKTDDADESAESEDTDNADSITDANDEEAEQAQSPEGTQSSDSEASDQPDAEAPSSEQVSTSDQQAADSKVEKITDFLAVSFVSSVPANETFTAWAEKEFKAIRSSYNKSFFSEYTTTQESIGYGPNRKAIVYKIKNSNRNTFTEAIMLVQGNDYRYRITLRMKDSTFNDAVGRESFCRMLKSFSLTNKKSSFIKQVVPVESVLKPDSPKTIALKNFNIKIATNNSWVEPFDIYEGQLDDYSYGYESEYSEEDASTEVLTVNNPSSLISLSLNAGIIDQPVDAWQKAYSDLYMSSDPVIKREGSFAAYKGILAYKFIEKYDIKKMEEISSSDKRKLYNYKTLLNTYSYLIRSGQEEYKLTFTVPVLNTSEENEKIIESLWKKVIVNKVDIGNGINNWTPIELKDPAV
ncbi:MAG: hypothetical protein ACM3KR_01690 [Deltaproteobacteria bacterium]